jgi:hypothetical protein
MVFCTKFFLVFHVQLYSGTSLNQVSFKGLLAVGALSELPFDDVVGDVPFELVLQPAKESIEVLTSPLISKE